jgi:hypothetical protein
LPQTQCNAEEQDNQSPSLSRSGWSWQFDPGRHQGDIAESNNLSVLSDLLAKDPGYKKAFRDRKAKNRNLLIFLVPEVGTPSIGSGQAPRHGVEAPRDFETLN